MRDRARRDDDDTNKESKDGAASLQRILSGTERPARSKRRAVEDCCSN